MENKLLFKEEEQSGDQPLNYKEREYDIVHSQSKRIRISSQYLPICKRMLV